MLTIEIDTANGMDVIANLDGDVMQTIAVAVEQMRKDFMKVKKPGKIGLDGSALREQILGEPPSLPLLTSPCSADTPSR